MRFKRKFSQSVLNFEEARFRTEMELSKAQCFPSNFQCLWSVIHNTTAPTLVIDMFVVNDSNNEENLE